MWDNAGMTQGKQTPGPQIRVRQGLYTSDAEYWDNEVHRYASPIDDCPQFGFGFSVRRIHKSKSSSGRKIKNTRLHNKATIAINAPAIASSQYYTSQL